MTQQKNQKSEQPELVANGRFRRTRAARGTRTGRGSVERSAKQEQLINDRRQGVLWKNNIFRRCFALRLYCRHRMGKCRVLLLNFAPYEVGCLSDSLFGDEFSRHRHQQVVVLADGLQAFRRKLPLHGKGDQKFAPHQSQAGFLRGLRVSKVFDRNLLGLANAPRASACLAQRIK